MNKYSEQWIEQDGQIKKILYTWHLYAFLCTYI